MPDRTISRADYDAQVALAARRFARTWPLLLHHLPADHWAQAADVDDLHLILWEHVDADTGRWLGFTVGEHVAFSVPSRMTAIGVTNDGAYAFELQLDDDRQPGAIMAVYQHGVRVRTITAGPETGGQG